MLPLKSIAFLLSFVGMSAGSLFVPILGVANYMMIYQVYPQHAWWHNSLQPLGIRYSMIAAVCLLLGILVNLPRMPKVWPALSLWDLCALGMVLVVLAGEFTGMGPSPENTGLTDKFVKMMIFVFCLTRVTTTKDNFIIVMWVLVLGSLYIGYDAWTAPRGAFSRGRLEVVGGPDFRHSSGLAAHMSAMLPLIAVVALTTPSWFLRIVPFLSGALAVNTVVLCRTRSAFFGILSGTIAALLFAPKRRRIRTYAAMLVAAAAAFALTDNLFWERMNTLRDRHLLQNDRAARGRIIIWRIAGRAIAEHPSGVGIGNFPLYVKHVDNEFGRHAAHNTFVLCAAELGVQGTVLFVVLVLASIYQTRYCNRRAHLTSDPAWVRYMSYGLLLSIITSLGTQMFTERLYTEGFWWTLALPGCLQRVVLREAAAQTVPLQEGGWADLRAFSEDNELVAGGLAPGPLA
ncbi:MAG: O-antigen ligase family protein [Phycisphaerae bacterium]